MIRLIIDEADKIEVEVDYSGCSLPIKVKIGEMKLLLTYDQAEELAVKTNQAVEDYLITEGERAEVKDDDTKE